MNDCMAADNTTLCNQQRHQNDNSINGSEALIDNNNELEISLIKKDARLAKAFSRLSKANATLARTNSRQEKRIKELVEELNLVKDQLKTYQISYNTLAQEHNNLFSSPLDNKVYAVVDANNSNIRGAKPQTNYKVSNHLLNNLLTRYIARGRSYSFNKSGFIQQKRRDCLTW